MRNPYEYDLEGARELASTLNSVSGHADAASGHVKSAAAGVVFQGKAADLFFDKLHQQAQAATLLADELNVLVQAANREAERIVELRREWDLEQARKARLAAQEDPR